jgi:NAD(P)-dependent dehydrogenase (short-subunit alcohol dehydrogenase family)
MRVADECKTASALARRYARQIKGKTVLTTGVSPGSLGAVFVRAIAASQPGLLVLAGRNAARLQETANSLGVRTRLLDVDLESLESVRAAAERVMSWTDVSCIDVFVNSAGVMATEYGVSPDGHERQLAVNHLGPWLFVNLIMDKILASRAPRVVLVGSEGHRLSGVRFDDVNFRVSVPWFLNGLDFFNTCVVGRADV